MARHLSWIFMIMAMGFMFWCCDFIEAQASPAQVGTQDHIRNPPPTNHQQSGKSQRQLERCSRKNRGQQISKPERNRLYEGKGKKSVSRRKRKKAPPSESEKIGKKKRKAGLLSEGDIGDALKKPRNGRNEISITTERVDDIALLIQVMVKMGIQEAIDQNIRVQKNQRDLSWGWTALIWLAYILSEGDHRKVAVEQYVNGMQHTLSELTGVEVDAKDFTDDRLGNLARYFSQEEIVNEVEEVLSNHAIEAYELPQETVRVDATTVSGYHEVVEGELFQYGNSKDDPSRPQIKLMTGSLDPLGMPLAVDVVSGERADDGLYAAIPARRAWP